MAFAVPTVAGEMKRHLRDRHLDRPPAAPAARGGHARSPRLARSSRPRLGRPPSADELAAELGVTHQDLARLQSAIAKPADPAGQADPSELDASDARLALSGAFRTLDETDRKILYLRFVEERSRREVATELGMSQSALARRADGALAKLRAELEGRAFEEAPAARRRGGVRAGGAGRAARDRLGRSSRARRRAGQVTRRPQRAADAADAAVPPRRARRGGRARGGQPQSVHHQHARRLGRAGTWRAVSCPARRRVSRRRAGCPRRS